MNNKYAPSGAKSTYPHDARRAKEAQYTLARVSARLTYDSLTGILTWKAGRGPVKAGTAAGTLCSDGYCEPSRGASPSAVAQA